MNFFITSLVALTVSLPLMQGASWAARNDRALYLSAKKEYDFLSKAKVTTENRRRWESLADRFQKIARDMPQSPYAGDALFFAGKIYTELYRFDKEERTLDLAIKNWLGVLSRYPKSPRVREARYALALGYEEGKGDTAEARSQYQALIEKYPRSKLAAQARTRLDAIKKNEEEKRDRSGPSNGDAGKVLLTQIRYTSSLSYTRVIMELSTQTRYETGILKEEPSRGLPPRIYVDLLGARLAMESNQPIRVQDGLLRQVRVGQFNPDVVRVVLDMKSLANHSTFLLPDPYRLVIDIEGRKEEEVLAAIEKRADSAPSPKSKKPPAPTLRKIVLDPGHGGKDPGAIGIGGLAEKDIVLRVAKKLAKKLKKEMGIEVVLTREKDTFIALEDRTAIANAENADLFISLHVNSSPSPKARGIETYYLNNTDDEASIRLAARENATSRRSITDLQFILSDLIQNSKLEDSITLAHQLQSFIVSHMGRKYRDVKDLGVKKALFYVLVGAHMPSVLVEMFFVTNRVEGRLLARETYQDAIVDALVQGIKKYNESVLLVKNL